LRPCAALYSAQERTAIVSEPVMTPVAKGGWLLVFSDDFKRDRLGDNWRVLDGEWAVADGQLTGRGTLMLDKAFPGFQRLEFGQHSGDIMHQ